MAMALLLRTIALKNKGGILMEEKITPTERIEYLEKAIKSYIEEDFSFDTAYSIFCQLWDENATKAKKYDLETNEVDMTELAMEVLQ
jgi:hypothetical protein